MMPFLIIGVIFTLLVVAGGVVAWILLNRQADPATVKRRHREQARQLQDHFEGDEDFNRHFHRPTQNEFLETIQALDHLSPDWEKGDPELVEIRLKNELAEGFPDLCKPTCTYPHLIEEDVAKLAGKKTLSPEALETLRLQHVEQTAKARAQFHAVRAQTNALHQMTSGPAVGPTKLAAGSLPFRLSDEASGRPRRSPWGKRLAGAAVLLACLTAASVYASRDPKLRQQWHRLVQGGETPSGQTPSPTPVEKADITPSPANPAVAANPVPDATPPVTDNPAPVESTPPPAAKQNAPASGNPAVADATPVPMTPPPLIPSGPATTPPPTLAQLVAYSKARAVDKHPDLLEPNTELNTRFVYRYKRLLEEQSLRLQDPNWPEKLADECVVAAKPRKASQPKR